MSVAVDQALVQAFIDGAFGLEIAHENSNYSPSLDTAYAELTVFDAGTVAADLSDTDERIGVFQVILRYPVNSGAIAAKTKAEEIFSHFSIHSVHTYSAQRVEITRQSRGPGAHEDGWYKIVLRMDYQAFLSR